MSMMEEEGRARSIPETKPYLIGISVLLVIVALLLGYIAFKPTPHRWQYKIEGIEDQQFSQKMQTLGAEGWELVFARRASSGEESPTFVYEVIFKRPAP